MFKKINFYILALVITVINISISTPIALAVKKNKELKLIQAKEHPIVLQVATSPDFPPFEVMHKGQIVGIEMDIIKEISKETNIKFEWQTMPFATIIGALTSKKVDLGVSGFNATPERKKNVDFTNSYYSANLALLSKKDKKVYQFSQLVGKKVGVQTGTTMNEYLKTYNQNNPNNQLTIVVLDDNNIAVEMLLNEKLDAYLAEEMQGKAYSAMHSGIQLVQIPIKDSSYNIALQKNSPYTKIINDALMKLKNNGKIDKIIKQWQEKYISQMLKEQKKSDYIKSLFGIFKSSILTIQYAISSILAGLCLSLMLTLMIYSGNKLLFYIARSYVSIIRGTPLLLQMSLVYFGLSKFTGINLSVFFACVIAMSLNSAAYLTEIIRSGVRSIDAGQFEACKSLNIPKYLAIKDIYIPQVVHNIFPALINEFIALIKESSMASVLGGYEIMKNTNIVIAEYYSYFTPLIVAGISYYIMTFTLEMFAHWWEKRYKY